MRVTARMTGAALVVSAALMLTGCNGDTGAGTTGKDKGSSSHDKASKHKGSDDGGGSSGGGAGIAAGGGSLDAEALKGVWEHEKIGNPDYVMMDLIDGNGVVVTTLDASCIGTFEGAAIHTTCKKGHGFESGTITSLKGGKLTVAWDSGRTDVFEKSHDIS